LPTAALVSQLDGTEVEVWFEVVKPTLASPECGFATVGPDDRDDEVERVVYLAGERYDTDPRDTITVRGTLRPMRHAGAIVNGVTVPAWTGIRVGQSRSKPSGGDPLDEELDLLGTADDEVIAKRIGRTVGAVMQKRQALGIKVLRDRRTG
jgi:hypothetical protein